MGREGMTRVDEKQIFVEELITRMVKHTIRYQTFQWQGSVLQGFEIVPWDARSLELVDITHIK